MPSAIIESLDHEGRGIARCDGKAIFIEGALPGERVEFSSYRVKPKFEQATMLVLHKASALRVTPKCEFYGTCGGCSMQHLEASAQVAVKQRVLENAFWHLGRIRPDLLLPAIQGPAWGYRYRARLSVFKRPSDGRVLVGFHEKKSSFIADMHSCEVLPPALSALLMPLRELIGALSVADRIPQIEVAVGEEQTVLLLRNLLPFTAADEARIVAFGAQHGVAMWQQPGGPDTARPLQAGAQSWLSYSLPEFGVSLRFQPNDFTQVNVDINRILMRKAMALLDPQPGERIADLFCGLGNFSLPIAARGASVVGVEGSVAMVRRATENAELNGLAERCDFRAANLFEATPKSIAALGKLDKLLIDPPREGAIAVCQALGEQAPRRIVYVSCNPATLARDAALLVGEKGYRLISAGVANMFPQTSHVESIALFERS
ncbi:23S rRNA (uracil(1939)-C(5))-methyltransferase RlmD [Uliginosibacterium aquaticum]|uniref:23S rRNA (uracil(1939)-C(5))-methyltransferase RlmD n=1 Tax=Uliginosibacterium aquaticum TaxID=2731212 RepID=A0ABX2IJ73_9RHOO|nr:23S rRNA (uracil(1939)-C(5))-methyltransferase RlmD [Uliginosibacterium aquaticum]NSL56537.1 23S rRNA (uracil(1939)-C(5))-methyltransferase RlmD [Uliginosibacterium aquaticum]